MSENTKKIKEPFKQACSKCYLGDCSVDLCACHYNPKGICPCHKPQEVKGCGKIHCPYKIEDCPIDKCGINCSPTKETIKEEGCKCEELNYRGGMTLIGGFGHNQDCPMFTPPDKMVEEEFILDGRCTCGYEKARGKKCKFCIRPPQVEQEEWEKEFDRRFPKVFETIKCPHELKDLPLNELNGVLKDFIAKTLSTARKEERQFILNILDGIDEADRQMGNKGGGTEAIRFALKSRLIE